MPPPIVWPPDIAYPCPYGDVSYTLSDPSQDAVNNLFMSLAAHVRDVHGDEAAAVALEAVVLGTNYDWTVIP